MRRSLSAFILLLLTFSLAACCGPRQRFACHKQKPCACQPNCAAQAAPEAK